MTLLEKKLNTYKQYLYFQFRHHSDQSKIFQKPLFHLIRSSAKIIEFDNVNFPKNILFKDGPSREFFEIDITGVSSKKLVLQKHEFSFIFFGQ